MTRRALGVALALAVALPSIARAQDAGVAQPTADTLAPPPPADETARAPDVVTPPPPEPVVATAPPSATEPPPAEPVVATTPPTPAETASAALARPAPPPVSSGAELGPHPSWARGYQYGLQVRYGVMSHHSVDVDATSLQLELLFPFVLDGFITPHVGASWGNFGRPAISHASRAWTVDLGIALSWIVLSWDSYVFHAQSLFNLEIGVDFEAVVQEMRTAGAAGGMVDIQSDFLVDLRPMIRIVSMIDRHVSVYFGFELSYYDLTGQDDFLHGAQVSQRPSQFFLGVQLSPQGRALQGGS